MWFSSILNHYNYTICLSGLAHWNRKQVPFKSWNRTQYKTYQGYPKYNIFINKAVKILVQKQKCWTYECCVMQMHFTFSHVCHLWIKRIGDVGRHFHIKAIVSYTVNQFCDQISSFKNSLAISVELSKLKQQQKVGVRAIHRRYIPCQLSPPKYAFHKEPWVYRMRMKNENEECG